MGYQEREQREFQGLVNTRQGAGAPRWSASDVANIDFQYHSIRGRAPMERVMETPLPATGVRYTGYETSLCDAASDTWSLNWWDSSTPNMTSMLRVYVSHIDVAYYNQFAASTTWFVAGSTGDSTEYNVTNNFNGGWALLLRRVGAGINVVFRRKMDLSGVPLESELQVPLAVEVTDVACIEVRFDAGDGTTDQTVEMEWFKNGSTSAEAAAAPVTYAPAYTGLASGAHRLTVGGFVPGGVAYKNSMDHYHGTVGDIVLTQGLLGRMSGAYMRWQQFPQPGGPVRRQEAWPGMGMNADDKVLYAYTHTGVGTYSYNVGNSNDSGMLHHYPMPPTISAGRLEMPPTEAAISYSDATVQIKETSAWGVEFDLQVDGVAHGPASTAVPGGTIMTCADAAGRTYAWDVFTRPATASGDYDLIVAVYGLGDQTAGPRRWGVRFLDYRNLDYGVSYKFAWFAQTDFSTSVYLTQLTAFYKFATATSYPATAEDQGYLDGKPLAITDLQLGNVYEGAIAGHYASWGAIKIMANIDVFPGNFGGSDADAAVANDDFTVLAYDFSNAANGKTATKPYGQRFLQWRDVQRNAVPLYKRNEYDRNPWACIEHMQGGSQAPTHGLYVSSDTYGTDVQVQLNAFKSGGAHRTDVTNGTSAAVRHAILYGCPSAQCNAVTAKDRTYVFGDGMKPYKITMNEGHECGSRPPAVAATATDASNPLSSLQQNTYYRYRFALYNTQTGEESLLSPVQTALVHETSAVTPAITISISRFAVGNNSDWDMISVYRAGQNDGLYYLEQQVPLPKYDPILTGDSIDIVSTMSENELLLRPLEEVDNGAPPNFTAAVVSGRCMVVGGGGSNPGYVYYSKPNRFESFPAAFLWQLNDDDSDRVTSLHTLFGRLVILKQRSMWTTRDDSPLTGQEPVLVHDGRGCVNGGASVLADNQLFFVSPDRVVYMTDGVELQDISSQSIRRTMDGLTDEQLSKVQLAHNARKKELWMSVPLSPAQRNDKLSLDYWHAQAHDIYVFAYDVARWSRYQFPHSCIATTEGTTGAGTGERVYVASPSTVYELGTGVQGHDGLYDAQVVAAAPTSDDALGGDIKFEIVGGAIAVTHAEQDVATLKSYDDKQGNTLYVGSWWDDPQSQGLITEPVYNAGPFASDAASPWFNATGYYTRQSPAEMALTYGVELPVSGVSTKREYRWWRAPHSTYFAPSLPSQTYLWFWEGVQFRKYASQLWTPQGEGYDYIFSGMSYVVDTDTPSADFGATLSMYVDAKASPVGKYDYVATQYPDVSHSFRQRGRRYQFVLQNAADKMEIVRMIVRFRVRGPRRVR